PEQRRLPAHVSDKDWQAERAHAGKVQANCKKRGPRSKSILASQIPFALCDDAPAFWLRHHHGSEDARPQTGLRGDIPKSGSNAPQISARQGRGQDIRSNIVYLADGRTASIWYAMN